MKRTCIHFFILSLFITMIHVHAEATGPWSEVAQTPPPEGTPAAVAVSFVTLAMQGDVEACLPLMTPAYIAWLERLLGVEAAIAEYAATDPQKRFAWRQLVEGDKATVWIRLFVPERNREVNYALNLEQTASGWRLAI